MRGSATAAATAENYSRTGKNDEMRLRSSSAQVELFIRVDRELKMDARCPGSEGNSLKNIFIIRITSFCIIP